MHGAPEKEKYFFPSEVCPLVFLNKNVSVLAVRSNLVNSQSVGVDQKTHSPLGEVCPLSPRA
jgi:hypothetical protein